MADQGGPPPTGQGRRGFGRGQPPTVQQTQQAGEHAQQQGQQRQQQPTGGAVGAPGAARAAFSGRSAPVLAPRPGDQASQAAADRELPLARGRLPPTSRAGDITKMTRDEMAGLQVSSTATRMARPVEEDEAEKRISEERRLKDRETAARAETEADVKKAAEAASSGQLPQNQPRTTGSADSQEKTPAGETRKDVGIAKEPSAEGKESKGKKDKRTERGRPIKILVRTRPNYGKEGRPLGVLTNWFRMSLGNIQTVEGNKKAYVIHRYRIAIFFANEEQYQSGSFLRDMAKLKNEEDRFMAIMYFMTRFGPDKPDGIFPHHLDMAFDGEVFLVTREQLRFDGHYKVLYGSINLSSDPGRSRDICMEMQREQTCFFNPRDVARDLAPPTAQALALGRDRDEAEEMSALQALNAVTRMYRRAPFTEFYKHFSSVRGVQIYRVPHVDSFTNPSPTLQQAYITGGCMHLQGLFSMVKVAGENDELMLNADVCNAVFRRPLQLMDLICQLLCMVEGRPLFNVAQVNEMTQLNQQHRASIQEKLMTFDLCKVKPQNEKAGSGPMVYAGEMGRPGVSKTVFGLPPRDRFFWRQVPDGQPDMYDQSYNIAAINSQTGGAGGQAAGSVPPNGNGGQLKYPTLLPPPRNGFKWQVITVFDYFTKLKGWPIRWPLLPTVNFRNSRDERDYKKRNPRFQQPRTRLSRDDRDQDDRNRLAISIGVPIEYLRVSYPQRLRQQLEPDQLADIIKRAAVPATERQKRIQNLIQEAELMNDPWMKRFSVSLNAQMLNCKARVLDPPAVLVQNKPVMVKDGVWKFPGRVHSPGAEPVRFWGVLAYQDRDPRLEQILMQFCDSFPKEMNQRGMRFAPAPSFQAYFGAAQGDLHTVIVNCANQLRQQGAPHVPGNRFPHPHLCMVILPRKGIENYADVKRTAEIEFGWVTQCLLKKTITPAPHGNWKPMTIDNICLKTNVKTGGTNWNIQPRNPVVNKMLFGEKTLLIGMDVNHPSTGDESSPSVAAMCSAWSSDQMSYHGIIRTQKKRRENVVYLRSAASEMLKNWLLKNLRSRPERVIIFRDGVAEGQFQSVCLNYDLFKMRTVSYHMVTVVD
uniref:Piwi domain-containing protein n=1 Tax=Plectus sambesii TaxID=2011161 RepID=A0A914WP21_9BILA